MLGFTREMSVISTVSTQIYDEAPLDISHLWGYFEPLNSVRHSRIEIIKAGSLTVGSGKGNDVVLNNPHISQRHCVINIEWNSKTKSACLTLKAISKNGVWINGTHTETGQYCLITEGARLLFLPPHMSESYDFGFIYHAIASRPSEGFESQYDFSSDIASGSFGTVKRAVEQATGATYAVKIIQVDRVTPRKGKTRLETAKREVKIMQSLRHPNICMIHESFDDHKTLYLVMELLKDGTLWDYAMETCHGLEETIARRITQQICHGMAYMHAQGITHRDLKPENILLAEREPPHVKICDFDKSQLLHKKHTSMVGTLYYVAPEVIGPSTNKRNVGYGHSVDAYSVGCITYFLLTLKVAFCPDLKPCRMLSQHIQSRTEDLSGLATKPGGVSQEVCAFIKALMERSVRIRLTMRAALNHKWFWDYEDSQKFALAKYDEGHERLLPSVTEETDYGPPDKSLVDEGGDIIMASPAPLEKTGPFLRRSMRKNRGKHPNLLRTKYLIDS